MTKIMPVALHLEPLERVVLAICARKPKSGC